MNPLLKTVLCVVAVFPGSANRTAIAGATQYSPIIGDFPDQTDAAVDAQGCVHLVYGVKETQQAWYRMFPSGEGTPTPAVNINGKTEVTVGHERGPKIGLGPDGSIYVVWQSTDGLVCMRSKKGGSDAKFEPVNVLDKEAAIDVPNIGNDDAGRAYVIWVDHRSRLADPLGAELYLASTDEKGHFEKNIQISDDRFPVCPCCMPEIQCSGNMIYVLYRSSKNGVKEMILRRADRKKMEWSTTVISKDTWKFEGCPMSGGRLAVNDSSVVATWMSDGKYYVADSHNSGKKFGPQRVIRSVRRLPLPTIDYLFSEQSALELGTLKSATDKVRSSLTGPVISIAWRGSKKDTPRLILKSELSH